MATSNQIDHFIALLQQYPPEKRYKEVDETTKGIGAVLRLLIQAQNPISAGQVSRSLNVSSARVAVLLRKMKARNLICTERDSSDGRMIDVQITDQGRELFQQIENELREKIGFVIDTVGMDRLITYAQITLEIHTALNARNEEIPQQRK